MWTTPNNISLGLCLLHFACQYLHIINLVDWFIIIEQFNITSLPLVSSVLSLPSDWFVPAQIFVLCSWNELAKCYFAPARKSIEVVGKKLQ